MELNQEQKLFSTVVQRAWEDPTFKQELIQAPEQTIRQATGEFFTLPEGKTLQVSDQSDANYAYLNIPPQPSMEDMELTDEQLEMVAGGEFIGSAIVLATFAAGLASAALTYEIGKDKKSAKE